MKPPILDRLRKEDLTGSPQWMDRVIYILNRFLESVVQLFTKNITFKDNIDSQIYTDKISTPALTAGYKIKVTMRGTPIGMIIAKIVKEGDLYTAFTDAPFPLWEYQVNESQREIVLHNILGIDNTSDYNVTLLIF